MEISKTVYMFTVLHPSDERPRSLEAALEQSDTGSAVGQVTFESTVKVPERGVSSELMALGNDGEFFNEIYAEYDEIYGK